MRGTRYVVEGYKTREEAQEQVDKMHGWTTEIVEAWPYPYREGSGERYAILCDRNGYLCTDGYVHTI